MDVVADLGLVRGGEGLRRLVEVEALIHEIIIVADDTVRPTFKLPLAGNDEGLALQGPARPNDQDKRAVRALTTAVGDTGIEPVTSSV